jgi:hypothetical protein
MKSRILVLLLCLVAALVSYGYSAEIAAIAGATQNHVESATASLPGWTETGYALYAD